MKSAESKEVSAIRVGSIIIDTAGQMVICGLSLQFALAGSRAYVRYSGVGAKPVLCVGEAIEGLPGSGWNPVMPNMQIRFADRLVLCKFSGGILAPEWICSESTVEQSLLIPLDAAESETEVSTGPMTKPTVNPVIQRIIDAPPKPPKREAEPSRCMCRVVLQAGDKHISNDQGSQLNCYFDKKGGIWHCPPTVHLAPTRQFRLQFFINRAGQPCVVRYGTCSVILNGRMIPPYEPVSLKGYNVTRGEGDLLTFVGAGFQVYLQQTSLVEGEVIYTVRTKTQ